MSLETTCAFDPSKFARSQPFIDQGDLLKGYDAWSSPSNRALNTELLDSDTCSQRAVAEVNSGREVSPQAIREPFVSQGFADVNRLAAPEPDVHTSGTRYVRRDEQSRIVSFDFCRTFPFRTLTFHKEILAQAAVVWHWGLLESAVSRLP